MVAKPNSLTREPRMNVHKNARMTVHGRALLVERIDEPGLAGGACRLGGRGIGAHGLQMAGALRAGGEPASVTGSSTPGAARAARRPAVIAAIERLRRERLERAAHRPRASAVPVSTVGSRAAPPRPRPPEAPSSERPGSFATSAAAAGELIHIDTRSSAASMASATAITGDRRGNAREARLGVPACRHRRLPRA